MNSKNTSILNTALFLSATLFAAPSFAQSTSKLEAIGKCVAGMQITINKRVVPKSQIPRISIDMFNKFSGKVADLDDLIQPQCPDIDSNCVRRALKNNNDYVMMNSYYKTFGAAMNGAPLSAIYEQANFACNTASQQ